MKGALLFLIFISTKYLFSYKELIIHPPFKRSKSFICTKGIKAGPGKSHNSKNSKYAIDLNYRDANEKIVKSVFKGTAIVSNTCQESSPSNCGHGFGNFIKVLSPSGYIAFYSHLEKVFVKNGEKVKVGTRLGTLGKTGNTSAPHLHFSIHYSWKKKGINAHLKTPVLLPESIPFKLNLCQRENCKNRNVIHVKNLKCSTKKITKYKF